MEFKSDSFMEKILSVGKNLEVIGVKGWALTKAQALAALDQVEQGPELVVLGGAVLTYDGETFDYTRDMWDSPLLTATTDKEMYRTNSLQQSRAYISTYNYSDDPYFELSVVDFDGLDQLYAKRMEDEALEQAFLERLKRGELKLL